MKDNLGQKTITWMAVLVLVMSLIYIFVTLGKTTWLQWLAIIWGFFLAGFLFIQSGIITYFQRKEYKSFGFGDIIVFLTVVAGALVFVNSLLIIQSVKDVAPLWLVSMSNTLGVITGISGGVLAILHMFTPRFS